jgi:thiosulfate/3-mercaptopyruvate sulfurtransferase
MLPTAEVFAEAMSSLGIRRDDRLVVYDTLELGIFSAPRVGWTLKVFGHSDVHILNNFRLWIEQGFPTESGDASAENATKSDYPVPDVHPEMVVNYREMKDIAKDHGKEGAEGVQVLDLRSEGRFNGSDPEPRPGLPSGHMPGSINIPLPTILDPKTKTMLPAEELRKIFEAKGIDPKKPIISTCGSGVMAAALDAALGEAQYSETQNHRVYDGSWAYVPPWEYTYLPR